MYHELETFILKTINQADPNSVRALDIYFSVKKSPYLFHKYSDDQITEATGQLLKDGKVKYDDTNLAYVLGESFYTVG